MQVAFTFKKNERLCNVNSIDKLFEKGNRGFMRFPFRFIWVEVNFDGPHPILVLFTVPRKNFPSATKRNRIKRQLRELYRLHKPQLYHHLSSSNKKFALLVGYAGKESLKYQSKLPLFKECINLLKDELTKTNPGTLHSTGKDL